MQEQVFIWVLECGTYSEAQGLPYWPAPEDFSVWYLASCEVRSSQVLEQAMRPMWYLSLMGRPTEKERYLI